MTGALLRTGTLKTFEPLGALGNPVYLAASQIRAAIGRRLGADAADVLAIPHRNQDGDTVDWYSPRPGPVVPWSAATPQERAQAKEQLLGIQERIDTLGQTMQSEEAGERQVFGRLLEHVTRFPDDAHVYLVDGGPVITFWGFRHQNAPVGGNPLMSLDVAPQEPAHVEERRIRSIWWWLLPLLLLLILLLLWLLRGCAETPAPSASAIEPEPVSSSEAIVSPRQETPSQEEPAIENPDEPLLPEDPAQPELVVQDGETRIVGSNKRVLRDETSVVEGAKAEDPGSRLQGEVGSIDEPGLELGNIETEAAVTGIEENPENGETDGATLDPSEGEQQIEPQPGDATEETPVAEELTEPPIQEQPSEQDPAAEQPPAQAPEQVPEQVDEPPGTPEKGQGESVPEEGPDTGTPDSAEPTSPPEPPASENATQKGVVPAPEASAQDSKGDDLAPGPRDGGKSLKLPPGAVSGRSTEFLNGGWRTSTSLQDPRTALPVEMDYQLEDGAGRLSLKRSDGSVCIGQVKAVIEDGKLVVQNAQDIRCPDGTNFGRPRLECVPGKDGHADCSGRYETGEVFSVDIKKSEDRR